MALYNETGKGKEILYPKTWLYTVAVNKSLNHVNRKKEIISLNDAAFGIETDHHSYSENNDDEPSKTLLNKALNKLKPNERTVIALYAEGLSYKEIAEIGGTPFNSVGKLISRTLDKMRLILKNNKDELLDR